jgi:hypothetical protein
VAGWSQLHVVAGCRLHSAVADQLKRGRMDPDAQPWVQLALARATPTTPPTEFPWQDAPDVCQITVKLIKAATQGWAGIYRPLVASRGCPDCSAIHVSGQRAVAQTDSSPSWSTWAGRHCECNRCCAAGHPTSDVGGSDSLHCAAGLVRNSSGGGVLD